MDPIRNHAINRKVIHLDMDAFYAAVEQRDHPELRGKPIVVGGKPQSRGVVATASYEARQFGIRSAMSCADAYRRCPQAIFVQPNLSKYRQVSREIREILNQASDHIEPLALDEAYLDVTADKLHRGSATATAQWLRQRIRDDLQLTASTGVGPNKLIAKIASDMHKPDGICVVTPEQATGFLYPLDLRKIQGIGPKLATKAQSLGWQTIGDLRCAKLDQLKTVFGKNAEHIRRLAWGIDHRAVRARQGRKQVSVERTFATNLDSAEAVRAALVKLATTLAQRLQHADCPPPGSLTIKWRNSEFVDTSRTIAWPISTQSSQPTEPANIAQVAFEAWQTHPGNTGQELRLLGLSAHRWQDNPAEEEIEEPGEQQYTLDLS